MTPNQRRVSRTRDLQLSLTALLAFMSWLSLLAFFIVIPVLYLKKVTLTWPMLIGAACLVAIIFILYYLMASQLRCQVCGGPVFGGGEGHRKHPNATKFLGLSYSRKVAWEILTSSGFHCMHCQTFCRSRRKGNAFQDITPPMETAGGNRPQVFHPSHAEPAESGKAPNGPAVFSNLFAANEPAPAAPQPTPAPVAAPTKTIAHPERTPWAHHSTVSPFSKPDTMNPAPAPFTAAPSFPPAMAAEAPSAPRPPVAAPAGNSPFTMMSPPPASAPASPAMSQPSMPMPASFNPPPAPASMPMPPRPVEATQPQPAPQMIAPQMPRPVAATPAPMPAPAPAPMQMPSPIPFPAHLQPATPPTAAPTYPTAPVMPAILPPPAHAAPRPHPVLPSQIVTSPVPPAMPVQAPPVQVAPRPMPAPAPVAPPVAQAPAPQPAPAQPARPPQAAAPEATQIVTEVTRLLEHTRQSMDQLFASMLSQLQKTLTPVAEAPAPQPAAPVTPPVVAPPVQEMAPAPVVQPVVIAPEPVAPAPAAAAAPVVVDSKVAAELNAVLANAFAQSQRAEAAAAAQAAQHAPEPPASIPFPPDWRSAPPQSPFSLINNSAPRPQAPAPQDTAMPFPSIPTAPQQPADSPFAVIHQPLQGQPAAPSNPFAELPPLPPVQPLWETEAQSLAQGSAAPFTFLSQDGERFVPDPTKIPTPWPLPPSWPPANNHGQG